MDVKSREDGRIANVAVVVATGVSADGHRVILGIDVNTTEDSAAGPRSCVGVADRPM
jgi:transposase-like protein